MRILITGSSGQLGTEVARQLSTEHEITGLDLIPGEFTNSIGSLADQNLLAKLVEKAKAVIHIASLHARHLPHFSKEAFVNTNITGTLHLLELCAQAGIKRFVYTSTTSVYGFALVPRGKAVWVTEDLAPQPRDIYDVTKIAAEGLCRLFALERGLKVICLRTSRFFPEPPELLALYRLYRGADVRDVARAHALAVTNQDINFDIFNISAAHPFQEDEMESLYLEPLPVLEKYFPRIEEEFKARGWKLPRSLDRVYVTARAAQGLGYRPRYNFEEFLKGL